MQIVRPDDEGIRCAAEALRRGEVIAYPTETVYGLAVDPFSEEAIARLFEAKGRDTHHPVLLVVADEAQLRGVAAEVPDSAAALAKAFWPGPLSMLFAKSARVPESITAGGNRVCVRETSHPIARALCVAAGSAITSTSANRAGQPPARSVAEIDLPGVAIAIDGGELPPSAPSTLFDPESGTVVRAGAIAEAVLNYYNDHRTEWRNTP